MSKWDKLFEQVSDGRGTHDRSIRFEDLGGLAFRLGCAGRKKGGHLAISYKNTLITNLQPTSKRMAKPYQVRQVREAIEKYKLHLK